MKQEVNILYPAPGGGGGGGGVDSPDRINGIATGDVAGDMNAHAFQISNSSSIILGANLGGSLFISPSGIILEDDRGVPRGLEYDSDYSATFNNLSLTNKAFILFPAFGTGIATGDVTGDMDGNVFNIINGSAINLLSSGSVTIRSTGGGILNMSSGGNFFEDDNATPHGLEYDSDYSATYTSLSLITLGDLNAAIAALPASVSLSAINTWTALNTFADHLVAGSTSTATGTIPLVVNAASGHATYLFALGKNGNSAYFRINQDGNITDIGGGGAPISSSAGLPYFSAGLKALNMTSPVDATVLLQMNQSTTFPWFFDNRNSVIASQVGLVVSGNNAVTKGDIQEWVDKDFNIKARISSTGMPSFTVQNFLNNAAALIGGLAVNDVYRNGDILQIVH